MHSATTYFYKHLYSHSLYSFLYPSPSAQALPISIPISIRTACTPFYIHLYPHSLYSFLYPSLSAQPAPLSHLSLILRELPVGNTNGGRDKLKKRGQREGGWIEGFLQIGFRYGRSPLFRNWSLLCACAAQRPCHNIGTQDSV